MSEHGTDQSPLLVFGANGLSLAVAHSLKTDGGFCIVAHVVDREYLLAASVAPERLVAFDDCARLFPPKNHLMVIPLSWVEANGLRARKCQEAKAMGYRLINYTSPLALVWSPVPKDENVLVFERVVVGPFVEVGSNVIFRPGVIVGHHSVIGPDVFLAPGALVGGNVTIGRRVTVGMGAIVRDHVRIGDGTFVGAGAVVVADTEPGGVYIGNPARKIRGRHPDP